MPNPFANLFGNVLAPFAAAAGGWVAPILALGVPIFFMLSTIELMIVFALMVVNHDIPGMFDDLTQSVIGIGVGYVLLLNGVQWMLALIDTLIQWGGNVSGIPITALSPDAVLAEGWAFASQIFSAVGLGSFFYMPVATLLCLIYAVIIFIVFLIAAVMLLKLLIDSYVIVVAGSVFLPLSAFRFTSHLRSSYVGMVLSVGLQLFFTLLILSIAQPIVLSWIAALTGSAGLITSNTAIPLQIVAESFILLLLLWTIPTYIARTALGAVSPGVYDSGVFGMLGAIAGHATAAASGYTAAAAVEGAAAGAGTALANQNLQAMLLTP